MIPDCAASESGDDLFGPPCNFMLRFSAYVVVESLSTIRVSA